MSVLRYVCTNPWCLYSSHYTSTCPWRAPSRSEPLPRSRYLSPAQRAAQQRLNEMIVDRDFDLRKTPRYMRERQQDRPRRADDPGHRWLLVFVPVALLVGAAMGLLMLYL